MTEAQAGTLSDKAICATCGRTFALHAQDPTIAGNSHPYGWMRADGSAVCCSIGCARRTPGKGKIKMRSEV